MRVAADDSNRSRRRSRVEKKGKRGDRIARDIELTRDRTFVAALQRRRPSESINEYVSVSNLRSS